MRGPTSLIIAVIVSIIFLIGFTWESGMHFTAPYSTSEFSDQHTKIQLFNNISPYSEERDTMLILLTIGNEKSYGEGRSIKDFMETLETLKFDKNQISLGLLVGNDVEFQAVYLYFESYFSSLTYKNSFDHIHKVTLLTAPFIEKSFSQINRENRHSDSVQRLRRRTIARSRNFVLNNALENEKFTLFIDSDIVKFEHKDMVKRFIRTEKDIIVPRVTFGDNPDYDKNSWRGQRTKPDTEQLKKMDEGDWQNWDYVPRDVPGKMTHFETFLNEIKDKPPTDPKTQLDYNFELDSVGGAVLFAKSIVYKQGIQFPPNYIVGTTWDRLEGYDGIETEGLCYTAKSCDYKCWGMPNLVAEHSPR